MAEILVKAVASESADPVEDARRCSHVGDPVLLMPDGTDWGSGETRPPIEGGVFYVLTISDLDPAGVEAAIAARWPGVHVTDPIVAPTEEPGVWETMQFRRLRIHVEELAAEAQETLCTRGRWSLSWAQLAPLIEDKSSGERL